MALSLNGSTGISGINGSAGTPALQGGDADTGIFFGTDTASIATAGSERLIVDASGNINVDSGGVYYDAANNRLGIGTTSPDDLLHISASSSPTLRIENTTTSVSVNQILGAIEFEGNDASSNADGIRAKIEAEYRGVGAQTNLRFYVAKENVATPYLALDVGSGGINFRAENSDAMKIDSSGRLLVGTSSAAGGQVEAKTANVAAGNPAYDKKAFIANIPYATTNITSSLLAGFDGSNIHGVDIGYRYNGTGYDLMLATNNSVTGTPTERMRISSDGVSFFGDRSIIGSLPSAPGSVCVGVSSSDPPGRYRLVNDTQISDGGFDGLVFTSTANDTLTPNRTVFFGNWQSTSSTLNGRNNGFYRLDQYDAVARYFWVDSNGNFRMGTSDSQVGLQQGTIVGTQTSDIRLKREVQPCPYGLAEIKQLDSIVFKFDDKEDAVAVRRIGFSAQATQTILPEVVNDTKEDVDGDTENTKLAMEYVQIIPVLVNAIKELSAENADLAARITTLEAAS